MNRDTQKCAYKCSHCVVDGKSVEVYKSPVTDPVKKSKRGRLTLQKIKDRGCNEDAAELSRPNTAAGDSAPLTAKWTTVQHGKGDPAKVVRVGRN